MPATAASADIIEGSYTVVAVRDLPSEPRSFRTSPRLRRLVARILFWNAAGFLLVVGAPIML